MNVASATRMTKTTMGPATPPTRWPTNHIAAPTAAADGRVISQAATMRSATDQRTWAPGRPTPLPRIDPVATWVVERAKPRWLDVRITAADALSAAMPWGGEISTRPLPRVRMTRQPPM